MLNGSVTFFGQPLIEITIASADDFYVNCKLDLVVDTGFTECVSVTADIADDLSLRYLDSTMVVLADGSNIEVPVVEGAALWHDDQWRIIPILVMDGTPLIGMSLLYGSRLTLDVIDGGDLTISPLA